MNDSGMNNETTLEELVSRHKKEIKSLDGEKRASIKKIKGSIKGKKAKDSMTAVEDEYAMKLIQLEKRHQEEIVQWEQTHQQQTQQQTQQQQQSQQEDVSTSLLSSLQISVPETITTATPTLTNTITNNTIIISMTEEEKERHEKMKKLEKIRIKREKQRQVEKEREMEHMNNMKKQQQQPSMKSIEMEYIQTQFLDTVSYRIQSIPADGNCLYRAIASQISRIYTTTNTMNTTTTNTTTTNTTTTTTTPSSYDNVDDILLMKTHTTTMNGITYQDIRNLCATTLEQNEDEFGPFCEYEDYDDEKDNDDNNDNNNNNNYDKNNNNDKNKNTTKTTLTKRYQHYCNRVRNNSNAWGGHLEIRAISMALQRPIVIYSMQNQKPVIVDATTTSSTKKNNKVEPIRLSYHLHYYALGEHYNEVVPK